MGKLLKADFYRIIKSKLFLIVCIITAVFPVITTLLYLFVTEIMKVVETGTQAFNIGSFAARDLLSDSFLMSSNMGLILPIFITIFIGMDVSNGTLRNKIIAGRSRTSIYISHLISSCTISGVLMLANVLIFFGFSSLIFSYGHPIDQGELVRLLFFFITGLFTFFFSASISTALSLTIKHTAPAVIITVVAGMGLSIISSVVHMSPDLTNKWLCLIPSYTNNVFLASGYFPASSFAIGILSYVFFGAVITFIGLRLFNKQDIK